VDDIMIVTEGLQCGTSINTGSDKQTYYKLSMCGDQADSPAAMAQTYFAGGAMHGDVALVEAAQSARAFLHLVDLGVPFPRDRFGQFIGYKTDHDPRRRATSIGPYTSREMCRALIRRAQQLEIPVCENRLAVELITIGSDDDAYDRRAVGAILVDLQTGAQEVVLAENVVLAVGGPGGIYRTSVYPTVHTGAIGLGLMAGAKAQNLTESQFGLASIGFRWNVSGTFMQVVPRIVSTDADGGEPREFLREYFDDIGQMCSLTFLKGYQWPFDCAKAIGGSSIIDILVYIETVERGRRVWLDFREDPDGYSLDGLDDEAREYLEKSGATQPTPIERLAHMNPGAIELYADNGIDITTEPLEIALCAQHNNGGLAADHWWESANVARLYPVGEVNGSHGVCRPGGSALNSGQVGAIRAAERIANRPADEAGWNRQSAVDAATAALLRLGDYLDRCEGATTEWRAALDELQTRMSRAGAAIRSAADIDIAREEAREMWRRVATEGLAAGSDLPSATAEILRTRYLCLAHLAYLTAIDSAIEVGVGSRGSGMVLSPDGELIHERLNDRWRLLAENTSYREEILETTFDPDGAIICSLVPRREIPDVDPWFETAWAEFREGAIYRRES